MKTDTWYKVDTWIQVTITPVEVIKETEKMVLYINKRRNKDGHEERGAKRAEDHAFFKTLDQAQDYAIGVL